MASEKQLSANRRNASHSTGPRSVEGKERSSQNALTHGLTASTIVIMGEDEEKFSALLVGLIEELQALRPRGALELQLIEQLAAALWRLRRIPHLEAALFDYLAQRQKLEAGGTAVAGFQMLGVYDSDVLDATAGSQAAFGRVCDLVLARGDALSKISRYEAALLKQVEYLLKQLSASECVSQPR